MGQNKIIDDLLFSFMGFWSTTNGIFPTIVWMELKRTLRALLTEKRIKVAELSRATKVPVQSIHNWLGGVSPRNLDHLAAVASYLDVTTDYLITGHRKEVIKEYEDEINAGLFEVVLRRPKRPTR